MLTILQTLRDQHHAGAIPEHQLHPVRLARNTSRERARAYRLAHQRGQALGALAEVDRLRRDHDADRAGPADHDPAFAAPSTVVIVTGEAQFSIVTLTPAMSISMAAARCDRARRFRRNDCAVRSDVSAGSAATTAGTNAGIAFAALRISRRQANNCCGDKKWRRATALTLAPGSKLSATIRALSSADQSRRRPDPGRPQTAERAPRSRRSI